MLFRSGKCVACFFASLGWFRMVLLASSCSLLEFWGRPGSRLFGTRVLVSQEALLDILRVVRCEVERWGATNEVGDKRP